MAYLIVISSGDLSQKLTEWKCNIQGLALPNTTLNQQTLKRNLNVTHLQCFDVFVACLETIFRLLKDENKTRLNSKKKFVQWWTIHYLSCGGEGRGGDYWGGGGPRI